MTMKLITLILMFININLLANDNNKRINMQELLDPKTTNKKFDIEIFKNFEENHSYNYTKTTEEGIRIEQSYYKFGNGEKKYDETIYLIYPSIIKIFKEYDDEGLLYSMNTELINFGFEISKTTYTNLGNIKEHIDYIKDSNHAFTLEELLKFLRKSYPHIDLYHDQTSITKETNYGSVLWHEENPIYKDDKLSTYVEVPLSKEGINIYKIKWDAPEDVNFVYDEDNDYHEPFEGYYELYINGNTGKVLAIGKFNPRYVY